MGGCFSAGSNIPRAHGGREAKMATILFVGCESSGKSLLINQFKRNPLPFLLLVGSVMLLTSTIILLNV
jgi:hypothetical protein